MTLSEAKRAGEIAEEIESINYFIEQAPESVSINLGRNSKNSAYDFIPFKFEPSSLVASSIISVLSAYKEDLIKELSNLGSCGDNCTCSK